MRVKFGKRDSYFRQRTLGLKYFIQQASVLHFAHLSLHKLPHTHLIESNCKFRHNKLEIGLSWSQILTWSLSSWLQTEWKEISSFRDSPANADDTGYCQPRGEEGRYRRQARWEMFNHKITLLFAIFPGVESASIPRHFHLETQCYTNERSYQEGTKDG